MRRIVYHKDYKSDLPEKEREKKTKLVQNDDELKELGPEWCDFQQHPAFKPVKTKTVKLEKAQ